jgi:hypothetical protein
VRGRSHLRGARADGLIAFAGAGRLVFPLERIGRVS